MEILIGVVIGIFVSAVAFVLWNLQQPDALDKLETEVREKTPDYNELKARVKKRVKKVVEK